jgi:hypothetical protein
LPSLAGDVDADDDDEADRTPAMQAKGKKRKPWPKMLADPS